MVALTTIASIRFGYGPYNAGARRDAAQLSDALRAGDPLGRDYRALGLMEAMDEIRAFRLANDQRREGEETAYLAARQRIRDNFLADTRKAMARIVDTDQPVRERLVWFWADHFTALPKVLPARVAAHGYIDQAIRPHITGRFGDMLKAVVKHPFMLLYLDQLESVGPNSRAGKRRNKGLNENLAREVLELHTLGVDAAYSQTDVTQLAALFTGLTVRPGKGFQYIAAMAEPGAETVLGKAYGGDRGRIEDVEAALDDIALHPATATHLARKLAVHFVSDTPDEDLVASISAAYSASDGDLMAAYDALFAHPSAFSNLSDQADGFEKARTPYEYMLAALTAFGASGEDIRKMSDRDLRQAIFGPMAAMGQPYWGARGPDGWPEDPAHWISPSGLATRIAWARGAAERLAPVAPDPRVFLDQALRDAAGERLRWAVGAAETKDVGLALVMASAEFNRR
ncbi:MAG: DUF1800 domain-containing protein [Pseudomonadota bacterium]